MSNTFADSIMEFVKGLDLDLVVLIRSFYLLVAAGILFIYSIPALKSRFLAYGARATPIPATKADPKDTSASTVSGELLDMLADVTVPHSWFIHFYTLSIAACLFWLGQIGAQQPGHIFLLAYTKEPANPVPAVQVIVAWLALLLLSIRRYLECQEAEPSKSRMFFGHWIMGLLFYAVTSVAVWIEGDRKLLLHNLGDVVADKDADTQTKLIRVLKQLLAILFADLPTRDRILVLTGLALFFLAASTQSNFHGYLKYMKQLTKGEYTLPQHPLFDYTVTPHYAAECVEYLGLAMIVAPVGQVFNTTMLCCLVFVVVNLGVTADGTREWYKKKFGEEEIGGKARMIPFIW